MRMTTSASLCEGPIFYYYPLPYARVMVIFTLSFSFYPLASSACWKEHDIYIYLIGCRGAGIIIVDITLEVKGCGAKL